MRFLVFALAGIVLGYVLTALAGLGRARGPAVLLLVARLLIFAIVVGWLARTYGPMAGLAALVAAVVTRGLLARGQRARYGAESR